MMLAKLRSPTSRTKLDSENNARKEEIKALDGWAKGENDARKTEIANLKNFAESENDARKTAIAN